jgi:Leucine-rich repeat (LRR) protein
VINGLPTYHDKPLAVSGTSASAPVTAAMISLVNAERIKLGLSSLGWVNPYLYAIGNDGKTFNDVFVGDNKCVESANPAGGVAPLCCHTGFDAATGWDPVTGFGTPNMRELMAGLSSDSITPPPTVTPTPGPPTMEPTPAPTNPTFAPTPYPTMEPTKAAPFSQEQMQALESFCSGVNCQQHPIMSKTWKFDKDMTGDYTSNPCGKDGYEKFFGIECTYDGTGVSSISLSGNPEYSTGVEPPVKLKGTIHPDVFSKIPTLDQFDVASNELSGSIPSTLNEHKNVYALYLDYNKFSGPLPEPVEGAWAYLSVLWMGNNHFEGVIPAAYEKIMYLKGLDVANNNLVGMIPPAITETVQMEYLYLENNFLSGELPNGAPRLLYLQAHNNDLSGGVPLYSGLTELGIQGNIGIDVYASAANMSHIENLDLTVTNCNFDDAIFGVKREAFYVSNYYDGTGTCPKAYLSVGSEDFCKPLMYCQVDGSIMSKWGVVTSGSLKTFAFTGGFQVLMDEAAVEALSVNSELGVLALGPDPEVPLNLRMSFWGGDLSLSARNCLTNRVIDGIPSNIDKIPSLFAIIAPYGLKIYVTNWDVPTINDIQGRYCDNTLPEALANLPKLQYLVMPNFGDPSVGAVWAPSELKDPSNVIKTLSGKLLRKLDIRGSALNITTDNLIDPSTSLTHVLIGENPAITSSKWPIQFNDATLEVLEISSTGIIGDGADMDLMGSKLMFLGLTDTKIGGKMPALPGTLRYLEAAYCSFTDILSAQTALPNLEVLDLGHNALTGAPSDLSKVGADYAMVAVNMRNNQLDGELKNAFENMPSLEVLTIGINKNIGGSMSPLSGLASLRTLAVEGNMLTGGIDAVYSLGNTIQFVSAYGNGDLKGTLDSQSIANLQHTTHIDFSGCGMTGTVPDELGMMPGLEFILLADNAFTGEVASCGLIEDVEGRDDVNGGGFQYFDLRNNAQMDCYGLCWYDAPKEQFDKTDGLEMCTGTFSKNEMDALLELASTMYLNQLNWNFTMDKTYTNYLNDPCEQEWDGITCSTKGNDWVVGELDLSGLLRNTTPAYPLSHAAIIPPKLPSILSKLQDLTKIDLSNNFLEGQIPPKWDLSTGKLSDINLSGNKLSGPVPWKEFDGALKSLDVSNNVLTGKMTDAAFTSYTSLWAVGNDFTGSFPEVTNRGEILPVSELMLSGNRISGIIPDSYVAALNCQSGVISTFGVSSNAISGTIPSGLAASCMKMSLKNLYLDDNQLTGKIPDFSELLQLSALTLDNNKFTGDFPSFVTNTALQFMGIGLTDAMPDIPWAKLPNGHNPPFFRVSTSAKDGTVPDLSKGLIATKLYSLALTGGFRGDVPSALMTSLSGCTSLRVLAFNNIYQTPYKGDFMGIIDPKWNTVSRNNPNAFTGELPLFPSTFSTTGMYSVHMGYNQFTGVIPPKALMPQQHIIAGADFSNNKFSSVDFSTAAWKKYVLASVNVDNNEITTHFDDAFVNPPVYFKAISAKNNMFDGNVSKGICSKLEGASTSPVAALEYLDLTGNDKITCFASCISTAVAPYSPDMKNPIVYKFDKGVTVCDKGDHVAPTLAPTKPPSPTEKPTPGSPTLAPTRGTPTLQPHYTTTGPTEVNTFAPSPKGYHTPAPTGYPTPIAQKDAACAYLEKFYNALSCDNNPNFGQWLFDNDGAGHYFAEPCQEKWYGIECDSYTAKGSIIGIHVPSNSLPGTLPSGIDTIVTLRNLDISNNMIKGALTWDLFNITTLKSVDVSFNQFTGKVPDFDDSFAMTRFVLSHNAFSGPLPDFSKQAALMNISLSGNMFTGDLSTLDSFSTRGPQLTDLSNNKLTGRLNACDYSEDGGATLNLAGNAIDCYSACWGNLDGTNKANLVIDSSVDKCHDAFPQDEIKALQDLYAFMHLDKCDDFLNWDFSMDDTTSKFTSNPCDDKWFGLSCVYDQSVPHVGRMSFTHNSIYRKEEYGYYTAIYSYEMPQGVSEYLKPFAFLTTLDLSNNGMWNSDGLNSLDVPQLVTLNLAGNSIFASLDTFALDKLTNLKTLDMSNDGIYRNNIYGTIPTFLIQQLETLNLKGQYMNGLVGEDLKADIPLKTLNVFGNDLYDKFPENLVAYAPNLQTLVLSNNVLTGSIPASVCDLKKLQRLEVDGNVLWGSVPDCIGKMKSLHSLTLNDNKFTGTLPDLSGVMLMTLGVDFNKDMPELPAADHLPSPQSLLILKMGAGEGITEIPHNLQIPRGVQVLAFTGGFGGKFPTHFFDTLQALPDLEILTLCDFDVDLSANHQDPMVYSSRSRNSFTGPVPEEISQLSKSLLMLSLAYNDFTSTDGLPAPLKGFTEATAMYLQHNKFSGDIDPTGFEWKNMHVLNIKNNTLSGEWPTSIFNSGTYWQLVDVSQNPGFGVPKGSAKGTKGELPGTLCGMLPSQYNVQSKPQETMLREFYADETAFTCVANCWLDNLGMEHRYGFNLALPTYQYCPISQDVIGLNYLYDDNIGQDNPSGKFGDWDFTIESPDPCGATSGKPWYGIKCNSDGKVTNIELPSSQLTGMLKPHILWFLEDLEVFDVSNNKITELMSYDYAGDDEPGPPPTDDYTGGGTGGGGTDDAPPPPSDDYNGPAGDDDGGGVVESKVTTFNLAHNQITHTLPDLLMYMPALIHVDLSFNMISGNLNVLNDTSTLPYLNQVNLMQNKLSGPLSACGLTAGGVVDPDTKKGVTVVINVQDNSDLECAETCWTDVFGGNTADVKLIRDSSLALCGGGGGGGSKFDADVMTGLAKFAERMNLAAIQSFYKWDFTKDTDTGDYKKNPCLDSWFGVQCDSTETMVTGLNFAGSLYNMTNGKLAPLTLPTEAVEGLTAVTTLQTLDLTNNKLQGTLCSSINKLKSLTALKLGQNAMNGPIDTLDPDSLVNLRILEMGNGNLFTGHIADPFFCSLSTLDLKGNKMHGHFLDTLYCTDPSHMEVLNIYGNHFEGPIPEGLVESMPMLKAFTVSNNHLTGTLPQAFSRLAHNMTNLDVDGNFLTGTVPAYLNDMLMLRTLNLNDNQFTGKMPDLSSLGGLMYFGMGLNEEQKEIPDQRYLPRMPLFFKISKSGKGDRSLPDPRRVPNVEGLAFTGGFKGDIPADFFTPLSKLDNLIVLTFCDYDVSLTQENQNPAIYAARERNDFTPGPVPAEFASVAEKLIMISLAHNNFNDTGLPAALKGATKARSIYLQANAFNGPMNFDAMQWKDLRFLNLENNTFEGEFPSDALTSLDAWEWLSVANNKNLVGHVSDGLCKEIRGQTSGGSTFSDPTVGTLELLNIRGTGIACYAECWQQAHDTDPYFSLLADKRTQVCASDPQWEALQEIYGAFQLDDNKLFGSWNFAMDSATNQPVSDPCQDKWYGVMCNSALSTVTELQLGESGLNGDLPSAISQLTGLVVMNMSYNGVGGTFPGGLWDMGALETLDLRSNSMFIFSSSIDVPSAAAASKSLRSLLLGRNHIMGYIPEAFKALTSLNTLDLSNNYLVGELDYFHDPMPALQVVNLANNYLTGTLSACALVDQAKYVDLRSDAGASFDCIDKCWSSVFDGTDKDTKLMVNSDLKLCGSSSHFPTVQPTVKPAGEPTQRPTEAVKTAEPTPVPSPKAGDPTASPTKSPKPTPVPTAAPTDKVVTPKPTMVPTPSKGEPTAAPTDKVVTPEPTMVPTPSKGEPSVSPTDAPRPSAGPTVAPTKNQLSTDRPTPSPSTNEANRIDLTIKVSVVGVSYNVWQANKDLYDRVFKSTIIGTIGNTYIAPANIKSLVISEMSPKQRRALRSNGEMNDHRQLATDRVLVQAQVVAEPVYGDTADSVNLRLKTEVEDGGMTKELQDNSKMEGATGLEDAYVEEYTSSDGGGGTGTSSAGSSNGLAPDAVYGIVFGLLAGCLVLSVCYYLSMAPKESQSGDSADVTPQSTGIAVRAKNATDPTSVEEVHNPMRPTLEEGGGEGNIRSFAKGSSITDSTETEMTAVTRHSDVVPPQTAPPAPATRVSVAPADAYNNDDMDEDEMDDSFDGVSPLHTGAFGGERFSQSLTKVAAPPVSPRTPKGRQPSFISRRDTIPMTPEMAAAAAAATANANGAAGGEGEGEGEREGDVVSGEGEESDDPNAHSGGLTRAEFFAQKMAKVKEAKPSPPKDLPFVPAAEPDNFEEL